MSNFSHKNINIECLSLGPLQTNCYLIWDDKTSKAIIIDPADEGDFISQRILELNLEPEAIILTHAHFDHIMGLLEVKLNFNVPIMMHEADKFLLESLQQRAQHWLGRTVDPAPPADQFFDQNILHLTSCILNLIHTPGHTPGSICLYNDDFIISGDTLFKGTIGRTDFSYSDPKQMRESLEKLSKLNPNLVVYPGHGEPTTIGEEFNI